jgi:hypothetical protein
VAAIVLGSGSRFAAAQPADAGAERPSLRDSLVGPARDAYDEATARLGDQDDRGALEKYQQAYGLSKDPRLLFNMAVCDRNLQRYAQMQRDLLRYEQEAAGQMSPEEEAQVQGALAAIRHLVVQIRLRVSEAGAQVSVDGETVGLTPLATPVVMDVGKHTVTVKKEGFAPAERGVDLAGGEDAAIDLQLVELPHPGLLRIAADPRAIITVDRTAVARGFFDEPLAPGSHSIEVTAPGKKRYATVIALHDRETRELQIRLEDERRPVWPWVAAGVGVVAGLSVGAYFLFRPQDPRGSLQGGLFTTTLPAGAQ